MDVHEIVDDCCPRNAQQIEASGVWPLSAGCY